MTLEELIETYPEVETYFKNMPEELKTRYTIRKFPPGTIIHQKDYPLDYFGIVCSGDHRVINEFENGKKEIYDYTILFDDEEIINHITSIMAEDYGITELEKGIEDILKTYKKDKLISKRNKIVKEMEETTEVNKTKELENELGKVIIELAKIK